MNMPDRKALKLNQTTGEPALDAIFAELLPTVKTKAGQHTLGCLFSAVSELASDAQAGRGAVAKLEAAAGGLHVLEAFRTDARAWAEGHAAGLAFKAREGDASLYDAMAAIAKLAEVDAGTDALHEDTAYFCDATVEAVKVLSEAFERGEKRIEEMEEQIKELPDAETVERDTAGLASEMLTMLGHEGLHEPVELTEYRSELLALGGRNEPRLQKSIRLIAIYSGDKYPDVGRRRELDAKYAALSAQRKAEWEAGEPARAAERNVPKVRWQR